MADISLVQDNCLDDSDEGVYEQGDGHSGGDLGDDNLTPLLRIKKYAESENVYYRQMVPRILLELFKLGSPEGLTSDLTKIMDIVVKLADGDEIMVRRDMLEQIPQLSALGMECSNRVPALANIVSEYFLPLVVRNLGTSENQVRNTAHTTLFALMEQGLVSKAQAEIQVCPTVLALSRKECLSEWLYCHTDAVALMSKMVPLLGRDVTERVFLDRFSELCHNEMFYVRKVCASHFGDFCAVVGKQSYEKVLLPAYIKLCEDEVWGVRKACAEVAISVSCACAPTTRKTVLAPVFAQLLKDDCRWVRISAFQTLGPFISTFADPTITSLAYNNLGELVLVNSDGSEFKIDNSSVPSGEVKNIFYLCLDDLNDVADVDDYIDDLGKKKKSEINDGTLKIDDEDDNNTTDDGWWNPPRSIKDLPIEDIGDHVLDDVKNLKEMKISTEIEDDEPQTSSAQDNSTPELKDDEILDNIISEKVKSILTNVIDENNVCDNLDSDNVSKITSNMLSICLSIEENEELQNVDLSNTNTESTEIVEPKNDVGTEYIQEQSTIEGNDEDNLDLFNSYNYWYVPPDMPLDPSIVDAGLSAQSSSSEFIEANASYQSNNLENAMSEVTDAEQKIMEGEAELQEAKEPPQHIVPQLLIDYFISMTDPNVARSTEDNIAYHCAYSLPAVALTLGSNNWHLLKDTVETLAANMQYKVRLTIASSLHELALILGPDMASDSLTPIFNGFIKDLDEVKIGVLKHLAHFLRLITPEERTFYLPRLSYFLQNNHELNWRFRYELAEQLQLAVTLFPPSKASKHISYIAKRLLCDKVSAVREVSIKLVAELLRHISSEPGLAPRLLIKFAEKFAHSVKWKLRQTFVLLSEELLTTKSLPPDQFGSEVMPHLLDLSWDPVANVRLAVASTIAKHMIIDEYFSNPENRHIDDLQTVLRRLQTDKDRDVRQAAIIPGENYPKQINELQVLLDKLI